MITNCIYLKLFAIYLYLASWVLHKNTSDLLSEIKLVYFEAISTSYANWVSFCFISIEIIMIYIWFLNLKKMTLRQSF